MVADGPLYPVPAKGVDLGAQLDGMALAGVKSVRVVFDWAFAQRYQHWRQVPAGLRPSLVDENGIPTDFSETDQIVGLAAQRGVAVLPIVLLAPPWDAARTSAELPIPRRVAPYAQFLTALIGRYGPKGSFWQPGAPRVPIRAWQIWNEPNLGPYWPQPFARSYSALLHAAHDAVHRADPHGKVVLAGLPNDSWDALNSLYGSNAGSWFDVVAVHPYTKDPQGVITILEYVRRVMVRNGDARKPMLATEVGWPSSVGKTKQSGHFDFATTEQGQAQNASQLLSLLGRNWRRLGLAGFDWDTWAGFERHNGQVFDFAGLLRFQHGQFTRKPAYYSFRRAALALER